MFAIMGLQHLGESVSVPEMAFCAWLNLYSYPHVFTDDASFSV
jgi:hypothetical protein